MSQPSPRHTFHKLVMALPHKKARRWWPAGAVVLQEVSKPPDKGHRGD